MQAAFAESKHTIALLRRLLEGIAGVISIAVNRSNLAFNALSVARHLPEDISPTCHAATLN